MIYDLEKLLALDKELYWRKWPEEPPEEGVDVYCINIPNHKVPGIFRLIKYNDGSLFLVADSLNVSGHDYQVEMINEREPCRWLPLGPLLKYLEEKEK